MTTATHPRRRGTSTFTSACLFKRVCPLVNTFSDERSFRLVGIETVLLRPTTASMAVPKKKIQGVDDFSHLKMRTMFGPQTLSHRQSGPSFGFGASTREVRAKIFISQAHNATESGSASPGPLAYGLGSMCGKQVDGRKKSQPRWMFGTAERFKFDKRHASPGPGAYGVTASVGAQVSSAIQSAPSFGFGSAERRHVEKVYLSEEHQKSLHGCDSPGPLAAYRLADSVGRQESSRKANHPTYTFGGGGRFRNESESRAAKLPGPGTYELLASVGPQVASNRASSPMPGFGASTRQTQDKLYISPEHEKMHFGKLSPGPQSGTYTMPPTVGKQFLSRNKSMPSWGFSTATRFASDKKGLRGSDTPGPGAYSV